MKTEERTYVMCIFTGKVCYTECEAGGLINDCKKTCLFRKESFWKKNAF